MILLKKQHCDKEAAEAEKKLSETNLISKKKYLNSKTLYKFSPFYQKFHKIFESIEMFSSGSLNPFYNEKFGQTFLQKHIAYVPFFGGTFMKLDVFKTRANNGAVERFLA